MKWTAEEIEYLKKNYLKSSKDELIHNLNRRWETILWKCREIGLKNSNYVYSRYFSLNYDYFEKVTMRNSYWGGFIAADGCIRKDNKILEICLNYKDKSILENLKKDLNYGGEIKFRKNLNQYRLLIKNKKIVEDLYKNFNITSGKTLTYTPPELDIINSLCFIRGFLDGDGCIKYNKKNKMTIDFNGNLKTIKWIKKTLTIINAEKTGNSSIIKTGKIYRWSLHGKNANYFFNVFKSLKTHELKRKWEKGEREKKFNLKNFIGGWCIGRFLPSIFINEDFEIAIKRYEIGDYEKSHHHDVATEYTIIVSGVVEMNGNRYKEDDIIVIEPRESTDFKCLTHVVTCVVKVPSVKNDKYDDTDIT